MDFGADRDLEEGWAHLGTDKIRQRLNLRERIIELNGRVHFGACAADLLVEEGRCVGVRLRDGSEERADVVVVATGKSTRDSWRTMINPGARPNKIHSDWGRIEHPQRLIDMSRYGSERGELPAASYRLVSRPSTQRNGGTRFVCSVERLETVKKDGLSNGMSYSGEKPFGNRQCCRSDP